MRLWPLFFFASWSFFWSTVNTYKGYFAKAHILPLRSFNLTHFQEETSRQRGGNGHGTTRQQQVLPCIYDDGNRKQRYLRMATIDLDYRTQKLLLLSQTTFIHRYYPCKLQHLYTYNRNVVKLQQHRQGNAHSQQRGCWNRTRQLAHLGIPNLIWSPLPARSHTRTKRNDFLDGLRKRIYPNPPITKSQTYDSCRKPMLNLYES